MPVDPDALQRSVQELLARVDSIGRDASSPVSDELAAVIDVAADILGVDSVGILLLDEDEQLRMVAGSDAVAAALEQGQQDLGLGPGVDTVRTAATVAVDDLHAVPAYRPLAAREAELGVRAVVSAPVWVNGSVAGTLNAVRLGRHAWRTDEVAAAETFADVIAALLQVSVGPDRLRRLQRRAEEPDSRSDDSAGAAS